MTQIGVLGAFLGGLLAILSPCSALLLPSFFAYAFDGLGTLLARTGIFFLGLAAVLVPLGAGVGAVGSAITTYRSQTTFLSAWVIIAFGAMILLGKGFTVGIAQRIAGTTAITTRLSVFILGTVYGLAGFCSGPLLGAVLTVAVAGGDAPYGALLMAVYAAGMTVPLALLAILWDRFDLGHRKWLRGRPIRIGPIGTHTTSLISGALFVGIGLLFLLTAGTANLGGFLSADTEVALQGWLARATGNISNVVVALAIVLVAIGVLTHRLRQPRTASTTEDAAAPPGEDRAPVQGDSFPE
ncbi:cytochrome c biogenesis CcdA family protein [Mycolicibacterium mageritense]|uniref:cytochrome c biogenesis CcdA family protein n=1 Tax=Mycolicibacterium mageritense TaxID=53462 RepID=UPI0011DA13D4|nr:cytochrome c biogenesis CcdA family protein [Mycolicibacterium mageritense]TXI56948.1 MAG: cytochrome c biogenesis protein CcdA [Mycolicibacterium mageritense]